MTNTETYVDTTTKPIEILNRYSKQDFYLLLMKLWVITIPLITVGLFFTGLTLIVISQFTGLFWLIIPAGFIVWITGMFFIDKIIDKNIV